MSDSLTGRAGCDGSPDDDCGGGCFDRYWSRAGTRSWANGQAGWAVCYDTWVSRNPGSADANEIGESGGDFLLGSTPSCNAVDNILSEVINLAVATAIGVVLAAGLGDPGVQALWEDVRAWR